MGIILLYYCLFNHRLLCLIHLTKSFENLNLRPNKGPAPPIHTTTQYLWSSHALRYRDNLGEYAKTCGFVPEKYNTKYGIMGEGLAWLRVEDS